MNPLDFSILGVAWPMPSRLAAKRAGAPLPVHVVTVERQQGINARPGIPQVRRVRQARPPRADGAKPVVHRQHNPDAGQGVARVISAGQGARLVANVKQGALHNVFRPFYSPRLSAGTKHTRIRGYE